MSWTGCARNDAIVGTLVAGPGQTQATGTQVPGQAGSIGIFTVTSTLGANAVVLPVSGQGAQITFMNISGTAFSMYPAVGEQINTSGVNGVLNIQANTSTTFNCVVQGQWWTNPRAPS